MNDELKSRIIRCEQSIQRVNLELTRLEAHIQSRLKVFGQLREQVIKTVLHDFIVINELIGKSIKSGEYHIPSSFKLEMFQVTECKLPQLKPIEKFNQIAPLITNGIQSFNYFIQKNHYNLNNNHYTQNNPNGGILLLNIASSLLNYFTAKAEQREAEETAVRDYEKQVKAQLSISNGFIEFLREGLIPRINELTIVTEDIRKRSIEALATLKSHMKDHFDFMNNENVNAYQSATLFVQQVSKLAKIRILDDQNELSTYDTQFLIEYKKIMTI